MSAPKTLAEMAEEYRLKQARLPLDRMSDVAEIYLAGARAALALPEVRAMREALELASKDRWSTTSQSTGIVYSGDTDLGHIATNALAAFDKLMKEGAE